MPHIDQNVYLKVYPAIAANTALFLFALLRRPFLQKYLLFFSLTTLADILVAGKIIPLPDENTRTALEFVFVLIGDLRYIVLLAFLLYAARPLSDLKNFRIAGDIIRPALIFTLFPTLLVSAIGFAKPLLMTEPRHKFLAYELCFFALTVLWTFVVLPQKPIADDARHFIRRVSRAVLLFYGLWSLADILILRGIEGGYGVRIAPNLLYYCGFLWWVHRAGEKSRVFSTLRAE